MRTIRDKHALVTGAASGIGRAIALKLASEGAHLHLFDINPVGLTQVVTEAKQKGVHATGHLCDVSKPAEISAGVARLLDRCPDIDILVNNAGITYYGQTEHMSTEDCQRLLAVNLLAPIQFTRELLPTLLGQRESHVLNVASFFGLIGTRRLAAYTASKYGLVGFSESLRAEYARSSLGVTALCPGFVDTDLFATASLGYDRSSQKLPPRWMLTTPEKIADRALRAIYRNRALEITQWYARVAYAGKRFFPSLLDWANHLSRKKFSVHKSESDVQVEPLRKAA